MPSDFALVLTLAGDPVPQPRARHIPGRRKPVSTASPKAKRYRTALERAAREAVQNLGGAGAVREAFASHALAVSILATFSTRHDQRWGKPHTHKPDRDNLEKLVLDCLTRAEALGGDDSRVADGPVRKVWGRTGSLSLEVRIAPDTGDAPRPTKGSAVLMAAPDWLRR